MKRIPLILSLALLLLLPAIALYPMLHASAKRMVSIAAQPFRRPPHRKPPRQRPPHRKPPHQKPPHRRPPHRKPPRWTAPSLPPPPSVVLSTPMVFPSPTASSRRFTAI